MSDQTMQCFKCRSAPASNSIPWDIGYDRGITELCDDCAEEFQGRYE